MIVIYDQAVFPAVKEVVNKVTSCLQQEILFLGHSSAVTSITASQVKEVTLIPLINFGSLHSHQVMLSTEFFQHLSSLIALTHKFLSLKSPPICKIVFSSQSSCFENVKMMKMKVPPLETKYNTTINNMADAFFSTYWLVRFRRSLRSYPMSLSYQILPSYALLTSLLT